VGMVGGKVFFRGPHKGFSQADAKIVPIEEESWQWLLKNLKIYLEAIKRPELFENLSDPGQWQLLVVRTPEEKMGRRKRSMESFRTEVWDQELGTED